MRCKLVFIIFSVIASKSISQWTTTNVPNLPRAEQNMACAAINDSIFIFGGRYSSQQLSEYIVSENRMVDHGENALSEITHGFGQYYAQFEHILYITAHIDGLSIHHFSIYDLSTNNLLSTVSFTPDFPSNIERGVGCCVAASDKYIFITGGWVSGYVDTLQIFELSLNKWYNGTSMQEIRVDHACIVVYDFLYVIGGAYLSSIAKININTSTFATQSWQYIQPLTSYVSWAGCVWYNDKIWIIGGVNRDFSQLLEPLNTVHVIDVNDDSVSLLSERLPYAVNRACAISFNRALYVFGGKDIDGSLTLNTGMKYELDTTSAPTNDPSHSPSSAPSHDPSNAPSFVPSANPSYNPSYTTSNTPSFVPSYDPSHDPSYGPSHAPSNVSSFVPSAHPSYDPSYTTSNTPSFDPSSEFFYNPTDEIDSNTVAINSTHFMGIFTSLNATNNDINAVTKKNQINMQYILIALIISIVIVITIIGLFCVLLYMQRSAKKQPNIAQDKSNDDVKLAELKKPNQAIVRSAVGTKQNGNKYMIKDGDTKLEDSNESSDGLWNIEATNDGSQTENETEGAPTQHCTDCGLQKAGKVYEGDQLFYCHDCFISLSQHATTNHQHKDTCNDNDTTITAGAGQEGK